MKIKAWSQQQTLVVESTAQKFGVRNFPRGPIAYSRARIAGGATRSTVADSLNQLTKVRAKISLFLIARMQICRHLVDLTFNKRPTYHIAWFSKKKLYYVKRN